MAKQALLIFTLIACLLMLVHGNRTVFNGDEGILLEPAQRISQGARPFLDFYCHMGPGSYWWQAIVFSTLGVSMLSARLLTILDFSALSALLFWLVAKYGSRRAAWITLALFIVLQTADVTVLNAQHRWDSGALTFGALAAVIVAESKPRLGALAGVLTAMAVISTPSIALFAVVTVAWLFLERRTAVLGWFLGGAAATAAAVTGFMAFTQTLMPFIRQMFWLRSNYSEVNIVGYGAVIGGYNNLFKDVSGVALVMQCGIVFCLILPATLPIAAALGWGVQLLRNQVEKSERGTFLYLLACMGALLISALPRPDVMHLTFVAALAYALVAIWIARWLSVGQSALLISAVSVFSSFFLLHTILDWRATSTIQSPVGALRVPSQSEQQITQLLTMVQPNQSLYVHPYMPVFYFLTQARNPTQFSFLAPGMMTAIEERSALGDLSARPPEWILFLPLSREEYLRVFPHATKLNERFEGIESWMNQNYKPAQPAVTIAGYSLLRRAR